MHSSLWKLLTAAGIIGIGTLVVLEVQNRLPMARSSQDSTEVAVAGNDVSVTPDASTELDRMLAADESNADSKSADFDTPNGGKGHPAPPADDIKFVGTVSRTVNKDDLTDTKSPFSFEEPTPDANASAAALKATEEPVISELQVPVAESSVPSPFPVEEPATVAAPTPAKIKSDRPENADSKKKADKSGGIVFFNNGSSQVSAGSAGSEKENAELSEPPKLVPAPAAAKVAAAAPAKKTLVQTTAFSTAQDQPSTFEEDSITSFPDLSSTPKPDDTPSMGVSDSDADTFGEDSPLKPKPDNADDTFIRDPIPKSVPALNDSDPEPFNEDTPRLDPTPGSNPADENKTDDSETLPFWTEESDDSTPARNPPRPTPANDEFPPPTYPDSPRTTPGTRPSRDRGDETTPEPFELDDTTPGRTEPRPLPSADEPVSRPGRGNSGAGRPDRGVQQVSRVMRPQLSIQKKAPDSATVGVSHDYSIIVSNEGDSAAYDVIVEDELGLAAEFVDSRPVAEYDKTTGKLAWNVSELRPGKSQEITVRIRPTGEGTLDGVATVRFKAQVKSATVITAPKMELDLTGPDEVKVGDEVPLQYTIRNRGTGDANNVILRSVLPPGLKHPEGGDLEYEIELLKAGDKQVIDLTVIASEPGDRILVAAEVTSSGISAAKSRHEIGIVGAQLTLERRGAERRYVGRTATYQNIVTNESKFEALNALVVEEVPEGMRFVSASNDGEYNPDNRRVRWSIPRLGAGKQQVLEVELTAERSGQMETLVEVTENAGFRTPLTENTIVTVEDIHNVTADISRQDAPVAIGERFGFTVTIDNRGTAVARNVEMSVHVPAELKVLAAGTKEVSGTLVAGNVVKYRTVTEIAPNESMTFKLTLQGQKPTTNAPVEAYLMCDEMQKPLVVTESVTVFDDRP